MVSSASSHMPDERYNSWDYVESAPPLSPTTSQASHSLVQRPALSTTPSSKDQGSSRGSSTSGASPPTAPSKSGSPPPRESFDSPAKPSAPPVKWRESTSTLERRETVSTLGGEQLQVVEPTFDESVLRRLCDNIYKNGIDRLVAPRATASSVFRDNALLCPRSDH